jgi:hypothetical protein
VYQYGKMADEKAARFAGFYPDEAESLGLELSEEDYEHGRVWIEYVPRPSFQTLFVPRSNC